MVVDLEADSVLSLVGQLSASQTNQTVPLCSSKACELKRNLAAVSVGQS